MKKKKEKFHFTLKHGLLLGIVILYIILCFFAFQPKNDEKELKEPIYMVFGADHKFSYSDGKLAEDDNWNQIFGTKKFYTYSDGKYLGNYSLMQYDTKLYLFDDANDSIEYDGVLFAYWAPKKIDVVNTTYVKADSDIETVLRYLIDGSDIVIPPLEQMWMNQKILVDIDGDGKDEAVYAINSMGSEDNYQKFSFLCYEDNGEFYRIISSNSTNNSHQITHYYSIAQIMDLDNDNQKELIVRDIQYGTAAVERYHIYKKKGDNYQLITSET